MSFIWRSLPAWPPYVDADGHEWKLAPNGFWWLHLNTTGAWHRASSAAAGDVLGIPVPWCSETNEREMRLAFGLTSAPRQDPLKNIHARPNERKPPEPLKAVSTKPKIPPDFADIEPGPGCCAQCRLDDGPLYDGDLCRYCWMLAHLTDHQVARATLPAPVTHGGGLLEERARKTRRTSTGIQLARTAIALMVIWVTVAMVLRAHGGF